MTQKGINPFMFLMSIKVLRHFKCLVILGISICSRYHTMDVKAKLRKYGLEDNLLFLSSICISTLASLSRSNFFGSSGFSANRLGLGFEGSDSLSGFLNVVGFSSDRLGLPAAGCGFLVGDIKEETVYFLFTCHPLATEDFFRAAEVDWAFQQLELVLVDRLP
ncbi:hypothetical protein ALC60_00416 [Trachymyrmex zeteki]|uniref:Uncharacterized protein n=1 Tax=Mycetomoellerius zeteki TaxID=64791 RepID=A0A151XJ39_9HYME|nr:hypothetical protein ALC60_00416 [Trachymyrmex zeteki]